MIVQRLSTGWQVEFSEAEGLILAQALRQLERHYGVKLEDLPERMQAYWRGRLTRDEATAKRLAEESELLADERGAWRSQRLVAVQEWLSTYRSGLTWKLAMNAERMADFLAVLNDRRLLLSVEHGIGQAEMDLEIESVADSRLREALYEIELLALFQMHCLAILENRVVGGWEEEDEDDVI